MGGRRLHIGAHNSIYPEDRQSLAEGILRMRLCACRMYVIMFRGSGVSVSVSCIDRDSTSKHQQAWRSRGNRARVRYQPVIEVRFSVRLRECIGLYSCHDLPSRYKTRISHNHIASELLALPPLRKSSLMLQYCTISTVGLVVCHSRL